MESCNTKKFTDEQLLEVYKPDMTIKEINRQLKKKFNVEANATSVWRRVGKLKNAGVIEVDKSNMISGGEIYKGRTTTFYERNSDGKVEKIHHLKVDADKSVMLEKFQEAVDKIVEGIEPVDSIEYNYGNVEVDCMTVYSIGDSHIGMFSEMVETGVEHGLERALSVTKSAIQRLINKSSATEECFIIDVGDYFHCDNMENKTSHSGNPLDVEGRYSTVLDAGLRLATELIDMALKKHKIVRWRSAIGNHNDHSAIFIAAYLKAWYRKEPRVIIHDEPGMFMYHKFGVNLIGVTHGHTIKVKDLGEIMAVDCKDDWSNSEYRYWYCGHIHHDTKIEYRTCIVETFRTLAPKDSWHHGKGYRSGQDMKSITLHKDYGEEDRATVGIRRIDDCR